MTDEQLNLLLTVARIFRARLAELGPAYQTEDQHALNKALAYFDGGGATQDFRDLVSGCVPETEPSADAEYIGSRGCASGVRAAVTPEMLKAGGGVCYPDGCPLGLSDEMCTRIYRAMAALAPRDIYD